MGSRQLPKSYDETTLHALEQALKEVSQVLKAHDPLSRLGRGIANRAGSKTGGLGRRWRDRAGRTSQQSSSEL